MSERLRDLLDKLEEKPCASALEWVGDKSVAEAWATCPRGDWMLWWLENTGVDCTAAGYWCAERARQSALRVLPPCRQRDVLAACAPITDRTSAQEVARAAAAARAAKARARGPAPAAQAAEAAEAAARAAHAAHAAWPARVEARAAELLVIADYVRNHFKPLSASGR